MDTIKRKWLGVAVLAGVVGLAGGCAMMRGDGAHTQRVSLSGAMKFRRSPPAPRAPARFR